jgi:hypothetical protein
LQIDAYSHDSWQSLEKLPATYYLGENGRYVFGAGPYSKDCGSADLAECQMAGERSEILGTFSTWEPGSQG